MTFGSVSRARLWLPGVIHALTWVGTLLPADAVPSGPSWLSIVFHVGAYFAFAGSLAWALPKWPSWRILLVVLGLALLNEAGQALLTTSRVADPADVLADMIGATFGLLVARLGMARLEA